MYVLRVYSRLHDQRIVLVGFQKSYGMLGIKARTFACKASTLPARLLFWLREKISLKRGNSMCKNKVLYHIRGTDWRAKYMENAVHKKRGMD